MAKIFFAPAASQESPEDVDSRCRQLLALLAEMPQKSIAVVSHTGAEQERGGLGGSFDMEPEWVWLEPLEPGVLQREELG